MKRKVETRRKRIACLLMLCLLSVSVLAACAKREKNGQDIQGTKESEGQMADKEEAEGAGQDEGKRNGGLDMAVSRAKRAFCLDSLVE